LKACLDTGLEMAAAGQEARLEALATQDTEEMLQTTLDMREIITETLRILKLSALEADAETVSILEAMEAELCS
jgi:hypothetical protein